MAGPSTLSSRVVLIGAGLALAAGVALSQLGGGWLRSGEMAPVGDAKPAPAKAAPAPAVAEAPAAPTPTKPADGIERYQVPVSATQPSIGPADALVTIVEWCDFRNEACKRVGPILEEILAAYGNDARLVYRHFIESPESAESLEFARIAHDVGDKFWEAKKLIENAPREPGVDDLERFAK